MEYEYNSLFEDLPDIYTFVASDKVSKLPPDSVPCNVEDLDRRWQILDHQPLDLPRVIPNPHYTKSPL